MSATPRVVVAAPSSGHGKTAVSIGLLAALRERRLAVAGFKIGPDYVDAAYLGLAAGRPGRNLDPRLVGSSRVAPLFSHGAAGMDVAVVEGTMGLYDGLSGRTDVESTAQIASLLRAPVVLVVDVAAMGQSVAALVHGFRAYDELLWLGGVILNRVASDRHETLLREALADMGVPVLGALRRQQLGGAPLPPRAAGSAPVVQDNVEARRAVRRLGEAVAASVDLDRLLGVARSAPRLVVEAWSPGPIPEHGLRPVIAVAGGPRFSYGYPETGELLAASGAEVVSVDPLRDEKLPEGTAGLVIGGGLPEFYTDELSANTDLAREVRGLARAGAPIVAEGAGLLYLLREYDGRPMANVVDAAGGPGEALTFGYRSATATAGSVVVPAGARVTGYKQHRSVVRPRSGDRAAWSWPDGEPEGFVTNRVHASQLCLHWAGVPGIAGRFVGAAVDPVTLQAVA